MKNELNRYDKLYSTCSNTYFSTFLDAQEIIPTLAEKTIKENIATMRINNKYALNLLSLRNFVQAS